MNARLIGTFCGGMISLGLMSAANAVPLPLESRLGGLAYYDPNLGITWSADADAGGDMTWNDANALVTSLTIGGVSGWRLPNANVDEMWYLYNEEGITSVTPVPFSNVAPECYWYGTTDTSKFCFDGGGVELADPGGFNFAWAVRSGDVPEPAALFLLAPGLVGMAVRRRRFQ